MSLRARLGTLASLPSSERVLAVRAVCAMLCVRAALWALPFSAVRATTERFVPRPATESDEAAARAVRRAVDRAARSIPGSACLAQALTAEFLLRRAGKSARLSIGVALDGKALDAHAWVESAGILVTGDDADLGKYRVISVFGADTA